MKIISRKANLGIYIYIYMSFENLNKYSDDKACKGML